MNILTQKLSGRITNYRTGIKAQMPKECLIEFDTITSASLAGKIVGQKVVWENGLNLKSHTGKIVGAHGRNGMVRVKFARALPGQAIGTIVELIG